LDDCPQCGSPHWTSYRTMRVRWLNRPGSHRSWNRSLIQRYYYEQYLWAALFLSPSSYNQVHLEETLLFEPMETSTETKHLAEHPFRRDALASDWNTEGSRFWW
jgi:hypothetical protein